jgi:steroid 5-alpha reductase family enzyme
MGKKIRIIFSVFALAMLGVFVWRLVMQQWLPVNWGMLAVAAGSCLLVFHRFLHIFTYSYAMCCVFNAVLILSVMPSPAAALIAGICVIYGLRLFGFFYKRNRSESYAEKHENAIRLNAQMPFLARLPIWLMVTWLMTFHLLALVFIAESGTLSAGVIVGAAVMLAGILIEAVADSQKQVAKSREPKSFVFTGLYRRWRHPNYSGQILVQLGLMIAGLSCVSNLGDALTLLLAPVYIAILMLFEARRLDCDQFQRYGSDQAYQAYWQRSRSLYPGF